MSVTRMRFRVQIGKQAGLGQQAIQVWCLLGIADDRAKILVLELEQEYMLVPGHPRDRRPDRSGSPHRRTEAEPHVVRVALS